MSQLATAGGFKGTRSTIAYPVSFLAFDLLIQIEGGDAPGTSAYFAFLADANEMHRRHQPLLLGLAAATYIILLFNSLAVGRFLIIASLAIAVGVGIMAIRVVPELVRTLGAGLVGGLVAGFVVLGPGLRVAMRVVAIMDPVHRPEFTAEGTVFILIVAGGIMGPILGIVLALVHRAVNNPLVVSVVLAALAGLALFMANVDLRSDLIGLGGGLGVNLLLFGAVLAFYGAAADRFIRRVDRLESVRHVENRDTVKEAI